MEYLLSIIIPTYKRTESLRRLIVILQKQTIAGQIEIVVVDQNPKNFLNEEIGLNNFPNLKYLWLDNPNVSAARNLGAKHSKGLFFLFLDDDLIPDLDFCEKGLDIFSSYEYIGCFTPAIETEGDFKKNIEAIKRSALKKIAQDIYQISDTLSAAIFFRKDFFLRSGGFDEFLYEFAKAGEDQEFFLRLKYKKISLFYITSISLFHDEWQLGGCDLRNVNYWVTREKCIKSWIYRYKIHRGGNLNLTISDYFHLYRSLFLNKSGLASGFKNIRKQIQVFNSSIIETNKFIEKYKHIYQDPYKINHL